MARSTSDSVAPLPLVYSLFFLWIEPVATFAGAYMAFLQQSEYMQLTYPSTAQSMLGVSTAESIVLNQLANLYFVFALNEALVLRATSDRRVWKTFLLGLLIADFGHLYSVHDAGLDKYYRLWAWNVMDWGNLGFVYVGAAMRTAFLLDLGFDRKQIAKEKK